MNPKLKLPVTTPPRSRNSKTKSKGVDTTVSDKDLIVKKEDMSEEKYYGDGKRKKDLPVLRKQD